MRPTTPTILFENMTKAGRESYAKSLLLRQQQAKQPPRAELWQADPTLYAKPIQPRPHGGEEPSAAGAGGASLRSAVAGPRPAPLQASAVSTSFMVAETGDAAQVSRGGTALSYGTADSTTLREHRHEAGGRTFVTATLEQGPEPEPQSTLPVPVLWQLRQQPGEEDPRAEGLGALNASGAADSAAALGRELRSINASRLQRVMGRLGETPARATLRKTREARRHAEAVLAEAKQREELSANKRILRGHTHDPGAETRPAPKAGRRAAQASVHPPRAPWGGQAASLRKREWDGEDAVLPSGPAAPSGFPVPLQYLELVRMNSTGSVPELGATSGSDVLEPGAEGVGAGFKLSKPAARFAGGGFAKTKPERQHGQEDYVELLRVAEVLEALNAVEGAVLQEHATDELMSYEQYLQTVMGGLTGAPPPEGSALEGDASDAGLAAEVAAAVAAGEESLAQASAAQEGSAEQAVEPAAEPVDSAPQEEEQEIQLRQPKVEVTAKADPPLEPAGPAGPELTEVVGNELTGYLTGSTSLQQPAQT